MRYILLPPENRIHVQVVETVPQSMGTGERDMVLSLSLGPGDSRQHAHTGLATSVDDTCICLILLNRREESNAEVILQVCD